MSLCLGAAQANELKQALRGVDDLLATADRLHLIWALLKNGDADNAMKTFRAFCESRTAGAGGNATKGMDRVEKWLQTVCGAFDSLGGLTDAAKGKLLLAGMKREWEAQYYAKRIKDCANLAGSGDATATRMADWFYYFAFLWQRPLDPANIAVPANAPQVVLPTGAVVSVVLFPDRIQHITDGHTFAHYVFDQQEVDNLERAVNGIQSFWPKDYGWNAVYADVKNALENDPVIKNTLQANGTGWVDVTTPSHIRLDLRRSANGVYRVNTAFPANIAQPDTHRIPQTFLKYIYELMAPGLGMATLKSVKNVFKGVTQFDKAMANSMN
jgi:hypothetical protein